MSNLTFLLPFRSEATFQVLANQISPFGEILIHTLPNSHPPKGVSSLSGPFFESSEVVLTAIEKCKTKYLAVISKTVPLVIGQNCFERLLLALTAHKAVMCYSDFGIADSNLLKNISHHPLCDYQLGSVRDNFDFGSIQLYDIEKIRGILKKYGGLTETKHAGWYELRLLSTLEKLPVHLRERLYIEIKDTSQAQYEAQFAYVDPANRAVQIEMESVFTAYSKRAGFFLPSTFETPAQPEFTFPVEASVIIPVKNREKTIHEAVESALNQKTSVPFNVLVVDNHSTDNTTQILKKIAARDRNLIHIIPEHKDLLIGGCWQFAVNDKRCGRYVMQLDSDDLYIDENTIERILQCFKSEACAAVVGSYKLVNFDKKEIPPGLIDHREWTPENGRNNALRINGLGAPRAFLTSVLREIGFPNTSYGEDYSVMLAATRRFQIGRIYEPLYLCRRWDGNSEANISIEKENSFNSYKDQLRSIEILKRQEINARK